jgi:signal transduction histidine kinase/ligand-binding sensor domain-containing protein
MKRVHLLLIILIFPGTHVSFCQSLVFDHLTIREGLSQSVGECILQDQKGFIWIGTHDGLNRFDGRNMIAYNAGTRLNELSNGYVNAIAADGTGKIWVGTRVGLNMFNTSNGIFTTFFRLPKDKNSLSNNDITELLIDAANNLWVGTRYGLNEYDRIKNAFKRIGDTTLNITTLAQEDDGTILVGTTTGIRQLNPENEQLDDLAANNPLYTIAKTSITEILVTRNNDIWIGSDKGLYYLSNRTKQLKIFRNNPNDPNSISNDNSNVIFEDTWGAIWVGTNYGLNRYNNESGRFRQIYSEPTNSQGLLSNYIASIFEDNSGVLWIGSLGGVDLLYTSQARFKQCKTTGVVMASESQLRQAADNSIWSICEDEDQNIWVGTMEQGLFRQSFQERGTCKFKSYRHDPANRNSIPTNTVYKITPGKNGDLWIGTTGGLTKLNARTNQYKHYIHHQNDPNSLVNNTVISIELDNQGGIWVGTYEGVDKLDEKTGRFIHFSHDPFNETSLTNNLIDKILFDSKGRLWIGTGEGVSMMVPSDCDFSHPEKIQFKRFLFEKIHEGIYLGDAITTLFEDSNGFIWVGSSMGLCKLLDEKGNYTRYKMEQGLPSNVVNSILEDGKGILWVTTNRGLSTLDPKTGIIHNFDLSDGLQGYEFNADAQLKTRMGEFYFGGLDGFNYFYPLSIQYDKNIPRLYITNFKVFDKPLTIGKDAKGLAILDKTITETKRVVLNYDQNFFTIEFAALHYIRSDQNQFRYLLDGIDKVWNNAGNRNYASYTNVPPGTYHFKVIGSNSDGIWNEEGSSLEIVILPPFWRTKIFIGTASMLVLILVYMIVRLRLRRLRKDKVLLENKVSERTQEIAKINDQLTLANTQLSGFNDELRQKQDEIALKNVELTEANEALANQKGALQQTLDKLQKAQVQLIQSEKMATIGFLTAGIAHEINNPINYIYSGLEGLKSIFDDLGKVWQKYLSLTLENFETELPEIEKLSQEIDIEDLTRSIPMLIENISNGSERAAEISRSLLTFSRRDEKDQSVVNIHENIDSTLVILYHQFKKRIEIIKDYNEIPLIKCYPGKLNQVLMNILVNAIQAIENSGKITISTRYLEDLSMVCVSFADTGKGISKEIQNKIFEPFFTTKDPGKGTGLGLSLTLAMVEEIHGKIEFVSETGQGSEFRIYLPAEGKNQAQNN